MSAGLVAMVQMLACQLSEIYPLVELVGSVIASIKEAGKHTVGSGGRTFRDRLLRMGLNFLASHKFLN